jgi:hypothetical protein
MADYILAANSESALLNSLEKAQLTDAYSYRIDANFPNGSKNIVAVSPNIAPSSTYPGKSVTFRIPRYGLISRMVVETTLTVVGDCSGANNTRLGSRLFSTIDLRTHNNTICTNTPEYIQGRLDALAADQSPVLNMLTNPSVSLTSATTPARIYTPFFMPFSEKTSMYLDASFVEQLELNCVINSLTETGLLDMTAMSFVLYVVYRNLSNEAHRAYQSINFGDMGNPRKLNMLTYNTYAENPISVVTSASTASQTVDIKCPHPVASTHFGFVSTGTNYGFDLAINSFSLTFSGRKIFDTIPMGVLKYDESFFGKSSLKVTGGTGGVPTYETISTAKSCGSIYYGESSDRTFNSHSLSLSNTSAPQLVVNYTAQVSAARQLRVWHEYWQITSIDPADGRIIVGNSF